MSACRASVRTTKSSFSERPAVHEEHHGARVGLHVADVGADDFDAAKVSAKHEA